MQGPGQQTDCAARLRVLAVEARLRVLEQLAERPMHVHELSRALGISQSLLSHHLKLLRDEGLVTAARDGRRMQYRLSPLVRALPRREIDLGCCRLSFRA